MGRRQASAALAVAATALAVCAMPGTADAHPKTPSRPTGVHVVGVAASSFTVALNSVAHASKYRLFASTVRSNLFVRNISQAQAGKASSSPQVSLGGLTEITKPYYYRVEAFNNAKRKFSSEIGEIGLQPATPDRLRAVSTHSKSYITWHSGHAASYQYQVEQATNSTMTANRKMYSVQGDAGEFTPYRLHDGHTYYFRVRALNDSTPSAFSSSTSIVVQHRQQSVSVMTYNIKEARLDGLHEGGTVVAPWTTKRKPAAVRLIRQANPDVIGVQEGADMIGHHRQVDTLRAALGGKYRLAHTEIPPSQPHTRRTGVYILYKKSTFKAVGQGGHWNLGNRRTAAHQVLRSRSTGAEFLAVSTHLWHAGGRAGDVRRRQETQLLLQKGHALAAHKGIPVVYVGDFNSAPDTHHVFDAPAEVMSKHHIADAYNVAQKHVNGSYNTGNGYERRPPRHGDRIDYVFAPQGIGVKSWKLVMRMKHGDFVGTIPSDHNPLVVRLSIPT